jgi:hypothetical protein
VSLKLLRDVPFGAVLCLVGTNYINSANAQQTDQQTIVTTAEAALAAKIKCEDPTSLSHSDAAERAPSTASKADITCRQLDVRFVP